MISILIIYFWCTGLRTAHTPERTWLQLRWFHRISQRMGPWSRISFVFCSGRNRWRIVYIVHFFLPHTVDRMTLFSSLRFLFDYGSTCLQLNCIIYSILCTCHWSPLIGIIRASLRIGQLIASILCSMSSILLFLCCNLCKNLALVRIGHCSNRNGTNT